MNTIGTTNQNVNGSAPKTTIAEVVSWTKAQIAKGDMGQDGGNLRITALNAMLEQVAGDEPSDAASVMANVDRLSDRWARKNPEGKAETARTYASRAKTTIEAYFTWAAAPDRYDPRRVLSKKGDPSTQPKRRPVQQPAAVPVSPPTQAAPRTNEKTYELSDDRQIVFTLPPGGITFADVKKFALHLLTLAKDFDVSDADQAQMFAMVVRPNRD